MVFKNMLEIFWTSANGSRVITGLHICTLTICNFNISKLRLFELFSFRCNIVEAEISKSHGNRGKSQPQLTQHFSPHNKYTSKADASSVATGGLGLSHKDLWGFQHLIHQEMGTIQQIEVSPL